MFALEPFHMRFNSNTPLSVYNYSNPEIKPQILISENLNFVF